MRTDERTDEQTDSDSAGQKDGGVASIASATSTIIVPRRRAAMLCYAMLCYALEQEAFYSIALFDSSTVIDRPIVN